MQNKVEIEVATFEVKPAHVRHFLAIHSALTPAEAAQISEIANAFSPLELKIWFEQLVDLTTPQAVQHIRVLLAGNTEAVS